MTFSEFFGHLWKDDKGKPLTPFPWQSALARYVEEYQKWPPTIEVPTSAGKTAIIDIAIFALTQGWAVAATRIFFVVDRRIVVDEARERAGKIKEKIEKLDELSEIKEALENRSATGVALQVSTMRGGMPLETAWAKTPTQPTICVSTVDQVGSRLLFRGYGVSAKMAPIHAGLMATDSLIILDEAHLSRPFQQTLGLLRRYRSADWCEISGVGKPLQVTSMSATLGSGNVDEHFSFKETYQDEEQPSEVLKRRLAASKKTKLVTVGDKSSELWKRPAQTTGSELRRWKQREPERKRILAEKCAELTHETLALDYKPKAIGVILNRVNSARAVFRLLQKQIEVENIEADVILLTGRCRPIDRKRLIEQHWDRLRAGRERSPDDRPIFVVATQCIEAGANLDFDALVTELASLDALRQRFGRLDRLGELKNTRAWIVARFDYTQHGDQSIYRLSVKETFKLLESLNPKSKRKKGKKNNDDDTSIDFGIDALSPKLNADYSACLSEPKQAPTLMPAYMDYFAQTNPRPSPDPDPAVFLHGPDTGAADVHVVWRADLPDELEHWQEVLALLPPTSAEALPLPIYTFRDWLVSQQPEDICDLEGVAKGEKDFRNEKSLRSQALIWRGKRDATLIESVEQVDRIHPGDTVILPSSAGGVDRYGWDPDSASPVDDLADVSLTEQRDRPVLRLHHRAAQSWIAAQCEEGADAVKDLSANLKSLKCADDDDARGLLPRKDIDLLIDKITNAQWITHDIKDIAKKSKGYRPTPYPDGSGWILIGPKGRNNVPVFLWEDDEASLAEEARSIEIHASDLASILSTWNPKLDLPLSIEQVLNIFPALHDLGKADPRFQDFLYGGHMESVGQPILAKSEDQQLTKNEFVQRWAECLLPSGWRHEFCSLDILKDNPNLLSVLSEEGKELLQHLIGTHHGCGRILAPLIKDNNSQEFSLEISADKYALKQRHEWYRLDSGWVDQFAKLQRKYGWYGLAYLETIVRLADHVASAKHTQ